MLPANIFATRFKLEIMIGSHLFFIRQYKIKSTLSKINGHTSIGEKGPTTAVTYGPIKIRG